MSHAATSDSGAGATTGELLVSQSWPRAPLNARDWAIAAGLCVMLLATALVNSHLRGMWMDEFYTLRAIRLGTAGMIEDRLEAGHSPLYFCYARLGLLLGTEEWQLRLPTMLAGCAQFLLMTLCLHLARLRHLRWPLWLLMLCHPYWVGLMSQLRYMTVMLMLVSAAMAAWLAWTQRPTRVRAGLFIALMWLTVATHATGLLVAGGFAVALGIQALGIWPAEPRPRATWGRRVRRVLRAIWPVVLALLLATPLYSLFGGDGRIEPINVPNLNGLGKNLLEVNFAHYRLWPEAWGKRGDGNTATTLLALQTLVLAVGAWLGWRALLRSGEHALLRLCVGMGVAVPTLIVLVSVLMNDYAEKARYYISFALPCVLLLAAAWRAGEVRPGLRRLHRVWQVGLVALLALQYPAGLIDRYDRFRETARWIAAHHAGEPIVASKIKPARTGISYYARRNLDAYMIPAEPDAALNRAGLLKQLQPLGRVFYVHYNASAPTLRSIRELRREGLIVGERTWKMNRVLTVGALISREDQRAWLRALPPPPMLPGPARKDF